jgi:hypothetical protein
MSGGNTPAFRSGQLAHHVHLTLNYRARWDMLMAWEEEYNYTGTLIAGEQSVVCPTAPTGLEFPVDPGVHATIAPTRYNNFSPRLGLACSPGWKYGFLEKTDRRAGKHW